MNQERNRHPERQMNEFFCVSPFEVALRASKILLANLCSIPGMYYTTHKRNADIMRPLPEVTTRYCSIGCCAFMLSKACRASLSSVPPALGAALLCCRKPVTQAYRLFHQRLVAVYFLNLSAYTLSSPSGPSKSTL